MANFSLGVRTSNVTIANACLEIIAPPLNGFALLELQGFTTGAAQTIGLGFPAAKGITPTTPVALKSEDKGLADSQIVTALAWGTGPTAPVVFLRRFTVAAQQFQVYFVAGLLVPANNSIVLWNITAGVVMDVNMVCAER